MALKSSQIVQLDTETSAQDELKNRTEKLLDNDVFRKKVLSVLERNSLNFIDSLDEIKKALTQEVVFSEVDRTEFLKKKREIENEANKIVTRAVIDNAAKLHALTGISAPQRRLVNKLVIESCLSQSNGQTIEDHEDTGVGSGMQRYRRVLKLDLTEAQDIENTLTTLSGGAIHLTTADILTEVTTILGLPTQTRTVTTTPTVTFSVVPLSSIADRLVADKSSPGKIRAQQSKFSTVSGSISTDIEELASQVDSMRNSQKNIEKLIWDIKDAPTLGSLISTDMADIFVTKNVPTYDATKHLNDRKLYDACVAIRSIITSQFGGSSPKMRKELIEKTFQLTPSATSITDYFTKLRDKTQTKITHQGNITTALDDAKKRVEKKPEVTDKDVDRTTGEVLAATGKTVEGEQLQRLHELRPNDFPSVPTKDELKAWVKKELEKSVNTKKDLKEVKEAFEKSLKDDTSKIPTYPGKERHEQSIALVEKLDDALKEGNWDTAAQQSYINELLTKHSITVTLIIPVGTGTPVATGLQNSIWTLINHDVAKKEKEYEKNAEKEFERSIKEIRNTGNRGQIEQALLQIPEDIATNENFGANPLERLRTYTYALSSKGVTITPAGGAPVVTYSNTVAQFQEPVAATYDAAIEKEKDEKSLKKIISDRLKVICLDPTTATGIRLNSSLGKKEANDAMLEPIRNAVFHEIETRLTAIPQPATAKEVSDATLDIIQNFVSTTHPVVMTGVTVEKLAEALFLKKSDHNYNGVVRDIQAKFEALLTPIRFRQHPTQQINEAEKGVIIDRMNFCERVVDEMVEKMPNFATIGTVFPMAVGGALPPTTPRQQYLRELYSIIYSPNLNPKAYLLYVELAGKHGQIPDNDMLYTILMKEQIHQNGHTQPLLDIATHGFEQNPLIKQHLNELANQTQFEQCTAGLARLVDHLHQVRNQLSGIEKRSSEQEEELKFLTDVLSHGGKLNPMIEHLAKNYHTVNDMTGEHKTLYTILARKYNALGPTHSIPAGTAGAVALDKVLAQCFIAINALRTAPVSRLSSVGFGGAGHVDLHQAELNKQHKTRDEYAKAQNSLQRHNFLHLRKLWGGGRINRDSLDEAREGFIKESRKYILETLRHEFPGEELNNPANKTKVQNRILQLHNQLLREFIQRRMQLYSEGTGVMDRTRAYYERFRNWHRRHKWARIAIGTGLFLAGGWAGVNALWACAPGVGIATTVGGAMGKSILFTTAGLWGAVGGASRAMGITGSWEGLRNRFGRTKRLRNNQIPQTPEDLQNILASHVTLVASERTLPGQAEANARLAGLGEPTGAYGAGPGGIPPIGESATDFDKREKPANHQLFDSRGSRWFDRLRPRQNAGDAYRPTTADNLWKKYNADNRSVIDEALSQEGATLETALDAIMAKQKAFLEQIELREDEIRKNNNIKNLVAYSVGFVPFIGANIHNILPSMPPCLKGWQWPWGTTTTPSTTGGAGSTAIGGGNTPGGGSGIGAPNTPIAPGGSLPPLTPMPQMPPGITGITPPGGVSQAGVPNWGDRFVMPEQIYDAAGTKLLDPDPGLMQAIANKAGIMPGTAGYSSLVHDTKLLDAFKSPAADFRHLSDLGRTPGAGHPDALGVVRKGIDWLHAGNEFQITPDMVNTLKAHLPAGTTDQAIIDILKKR